MWSRSKTSGISWWYWHTCVPLILFSFWLGLRLWEGLLWALYRKHHFLKIVVPAVISDTITAASDRSALATQGRYTAEEVVLTWRDKGLHWWRFGRRGGTRGRWGCPHEDEEMALWSIITAKSSAIWSISALFWRGSQWEMHAHVSITLPDDEQLWRRFEQFQIFQQ